VIARRSYTSDWHVHCDQWGVDESAHVNRTRSKVASLALVAALVAPSASAHASWLGRKLNLDKLANTGIIVTAGFDYGVPGTPATGAADLGLIITPKGTAKRRTVAPFAALSGHLLGFGGSATSSPLKRYRGLEKNAAFVGRDHPVYGDRVQIPIVPGILQLAASRQGGLGISLSMIPLPFTLPGVFAYPWLRGSVSLYVIDPRLAKVATPMLDRVDKIVVKAKRLTRTAKVMWWKNVARPLRATAVRSARVRR